MFLLRKKIISKKEYKKKPFHCFKNHSPKEKSQDYDCIFTNEMRNRPRVKFFVWEKKKIVFLFRSFHRYWILSVHINPNLDIAATLWSTHFCRKWCIEKYHSSLCWTLRCLSLIVVAFSPRQIPFSLLFLFFYYYKFSPFFSMYSGGYG